MIEMERKRGFDGELRDRPKFSFSICTKRFHFKMVGLSPLMINSSIENNNEEVEKWRSENSKAYSEFLNSSPKQYCLDDRMPGWAWINYLYRPTENTDKIVIPSRLLLGCFNKSLYKLSKTKKIFNSLVKRIEFDNVFYPVKINGSVVMLKDIIRTGGAYDNFNAQVKLAKQFDIELFGVDISIKGKPAFRVRPRISNWSIEGNMSLRLLLRNDKSDDEIVSLLEEAFNWAGINAGIGDWRPSSPRKKGEHGKFRIELSQTRGESV